MADVFLLIVRWAHAIAAVAWVGGGIFYWVVLRPALRTEGVPPAVARVAGAEFGGLVALAAWTLVVTGFVLVFARLSEPAADVPYGAVLALKIALSVWMFLLVSGRRRGARTATGTGTGGAPRGRLRTAANALGNVNTTVILGVVVFGLSDILRLLFERNL